MDRWPSNNFFKTTSRFVVLAAHWHPLLFVKLTHAFHSTSNQDNNDIAIFAQQAFTFQVFRKRLEWEHWTKPQWQAGNGFDMVWWTYAPNGVRVPQCFETLARFGKLEPSEKHATHLLTDFWLVVWKSFYIGNAAGFMMMPIDQLMFFRVVTELLRRFQVNRFPTVGRSWICNHSYRL